MRQLVALADASEINAFVLDIKDEFGINYKSVDPVVQRNGGNAGTILTTSVFQNRINRCQYKCFQEQMDRISRRHWPTSSRMRKGESAGLACGPPQTCSGW